MSLGLALGSGGARGWCHIGVLRQLAQDGIAPDGVVGCSMGALVGAAWAGDKLDALESWARDLTRSRFVKYMDFGLDKGGLLRGQAVLEILSDIGLPDRIEDLAHPFIAVAADLRSGREVLLREGNLAEAVRASVSIPGVFSPLQVGDRWLIDGGVINPVPVSVLKKFGSTCTIGVNPNAKHGRALWTPEPQSGFLDKLGLDELSAHLPDQIAALLPEPKKDVSPAYMDVVSASIDIMTEDLRKNREAADPPDVMLEADLSDLSVMELYRAGEAIDEGQRIAKDALPKIRNLLG